MPIPSSALPSPSLGNSMSNNPLLDESDQRAFSQFLEGFFLDQDFAFDPQLPNNMPMYSNLDLQERRSSLSSHNSSSWDHQPKRRRSEGNMASIPISTPSSMMMIPAQTNMEAFHYSQTRAISQQTAAAAVAAAVSQKQQQGPPVPVLHNVPAKRKSQSDQSSTTATESDDRAAPRKAASVPSPSAARPLASSTARPPAQVSSSSQTKSATAAAPLSSSPSTATQPIQVPNIKTEPSSSITQNTADEGGSDEEDDEGMSPSSGNGTPATKRKPYKELLTEEEKRANHIQSEQKRRNTIRAGFRDLTDLVPTLKNVNNSKSTILFKAVEYIRYLERRNRGLRDKVGGLEMRVEMEGRSNHGGAGAGNGGNGNSMGGPGGSAGSHRRGAGGGGNGGANGGAGSLGSKRAMSLVGSAGAAGGYYNVRHQHLNGTIAGMVGKAYSHHAHVHYASAQPHLPGGGYQQIRYNSDAAAVMAAAAAQAQAQAVAQAVAAGAGRTPSPLDATQEMHLLYSSQQYPHGQQHHQQQQQSQYTESSLTIPVDNEEDEEDDDDDDEGKEGIDSGYSESGDRELGTAALMQSMARNIAVTGKVKKSTGSVMIMRGDGAVAGRDLNMGMAAVSS